MTPVVDTLLLVVEVLVDELMSEAEVLPEAETVAVFVFTSLTSVLLAVASLVAVPVVLAETEFEVPFMSVPVVVCVLLGPLQ